MQLLFKELLRTDQDPTREGQQSHTGSPRLGGSHGIKVVRKTDRKEATGHGSVTVSPTGPECQQHQELGEGPPCTRGAPGPFGTAIRQRLSKLKLNMPSDPLIPLLGIWPRETTTAALRTRMFITAVQFGTAKDWPPSDRSARGEKGSLGKPYCLRSQEVPFRRHPLAPGPFYDFSKTQKGTSAEESTHTPGISKNSHWSLTCHPLGRAGRPM